MKKRVRNFILGLACALTCGLATAAVGCNTASDWLDQMKCEHVWNGGKVTVKATCTEEGRKVYECTKCGKEKKEDLEKLPHTEHTVEMKAPTCDEKGMTDYVECSVCNAVLVAGKAIPALGHTEIELPGIEATCTTKGKTDGKYCTRCQEYTVEQTELPALGHKLVTIEAVEATCDKQGSTAGVKCETCETVYSEPQAIPSLGHTVKNGVCTSCGTVTDATKFFEQTATMKETQIDKNHVTTSGFYRIYINVEEGSLINFGPVGFTVIEKVGANDATFGITAAINPAGIWSDEELSANFYINGEDYVELDGAKYYVIEDNIEEGYITIYYTKVTGMVKSTDESAYLTFKADVTTWLDDENVIKVTKLS